MRTIITSLLIIVASLFSLTVQAQSQDQLRECVKVLSEGKTIGNTVWNNDVPIAVQYLPTALEILDIRPLDDNSYYQTYYLDKNSTPRYNFLAIIDGTDMDLQEEYVILHAHLKGRLSNGQQILDGADYNASGVAALLEVAALLKDYPIARSILIVITDGDNHSGMKYFLESGAISNDKIKMVFSFDGLGGMKETTILEYSGTAYLSESQKTIFDVPNPNNLPVKLKSKQVNFGITADNSPVIRANIPEIGISTRSRVKEGADIIENIDFEGMEQIVQHISSVVFKSAGDAFALIESTPIYTHEETERKISQFIRKIRFGVSIGMGTNKLNFNSGPVTGRRAFAANISLNASIPIYSVLGIKPEIRLLRRYAKMEGGTFYSDAMSIPLDLTVTLGDPYSFAVVLQGGGYYNMLFRGKSESQKMKFGSGNFRRHEFGYRYGIGIVMSRYSLKFIGENALTHTLKSPTPANYITKRNHSFFVEFGIRLGSSKI